ncbi:MAG: protein phosphatase 2C domain-containing protein [Dehalococcoidia bacterium]|nr:protein phosphatase 2C domain-containing protein [Dehalococcoidia bacterium]
MLYVELAAATNRGRRRRTNEDRALARRLDGGVASDCLLSVADGVGGAPGGATASELAVASLDSVRTLRGADPDSVLRELVDQANRSIVLRAQNDPKYTGMATTLVVALIVDGWLWIANMGDSRAYLVRDGRIVQLTEDHSLIAERMRAGLINEEEAIHSPHRNVITRSLGAADAMGADIFNCGPLDDGDVVLLCSDGLYTMVSEPDIARYAASLLPRDAVRELIRSANAVGGRDNIAVAIARMTGPNGVARGNDGTY